MGECDGGTGPTGPEEWDPGEGPGSANRPALPLLIAEILPGKAGTLGEMPIAPKPDAVNFEM